MKKITAKYSKPVITGKNTHVNVISLPWGSVLIQGFSKDPLKEESYIIRQISFSTEAIEVLVPMLQKYLEEVKS